MQIKDKGFIHTTSSDITSPQVYYSRRDLVQRMATGVAGAALASWASREAFAQAALPGKNARLPAGKSQLVGAMTMDKPTEYHLPAVTTISMSSAPTRPIRPPMPTPQDHPWTVEVEGLVKKPARYTLEDLLKLSAQEERIYRLRCVEGWSMVMPWIGYSCQI
jgi:sulfoxide reductase catalytic subunit YedY